MNEEGTEALLNSDTMKEIYSTFRDLWEEGVIHPDSMAEAGPTWTGYFPTGTIGIMPMPASLQGMANDALADEDIGVTSIKGITGGESTFVGGDSIGISKDSENVDQAWNFLAWMLDEEAQVEVVAQGGNVVARTRPGRQRVQLRRSASGDSSTRSPRWARRRSRCDSDRPTTTRRVPGFRSSERPSSRGPTTRRSTSSTRRSPTRSPNKMSGGTVRTSGSAPCATIRTARDGGSAEAMSVASRREHVARVGPAQLVPAPAAHRRGVCRAHRDLRRGLLRRFRCSSSAQMSASDWTLLAGDRGINFPENYAGLTTDPLFWPAVEFTIQYTVLVTVLLHRARASPRPGRPGDAADGAACCAPCSSSPRGRPGRGIAPVLGVLLAADRARSTRSSRGSGSSTSRSSSSGTPLNALLSTVFLIVWKFAGFYMLILLVGLQAIPDDVYESAAIDGAGRWQTFRHITLPLLRPSLALALILCVTGSLLAFDQFFLLTKGGPDNSTVTIVQLIYREAFQRQNLGTAAALSIVVLAGAPGPQHGLVPQPPAGRDGE